MENIELYTSNIYDYGMRMYDARVGRLFSVDPLTGKYPELSPYQFASNRPIDGIDRDGLEWFYMPAIRDKNGNVDKKATMELLQTEADAGKGLVESGKGTVVGLWNIGRHPVNTVKNLWRAGTHLSATAKAIKKQTVKEFRENPAEALGKLTGYIAQLLVGGEIANGLSKAGKVSRVVKAEDVAADAVTLPKLGIKYFDEITDISRVTANQLVSYSKQFEKLYRSGKIGALTEDQAASLVKLAKKLDVEVRIDEGHPGTFWHMRHINIGPKTKYHIPISTE